jgi:hypothetical protein
MIKHRRGAQKSRRPEAICDSLNEAALNRIIQAAGNAPDDLKREELRSALATAASPTSSRGTPDAPDSIPNYLLATRCVRGF